MTRRLIEATVVASVLGVGCSDDTSAGGDGDTGSDESSDDGSDEGSTSSGDDTDGTGSEPAPCTFAGDGVCDEPVNCALGSDEEDCVAACESGENLHLFAAACAYRDPPQPPPDDGVPSGGTSNLTGHIDGTIEVPDGESSGTVMRHYRLHVPRSYDPTRSTPLVILMAGHRVPHYNMASYTEIARAADQNDFIVVHAEQQWRKSGEQRWAWWSDWNWSGNANGNPDLAFIARLINRLAGEYNIDLSRVYTAGHSRGAAMAFIAALELSDYIAGAWVQSGFTEFGYLDARLSSWSGRKVPMVFMHGIQDPDVGVTYGDALVDRLLELGWEEDEDLVYYRLDNVTHRWQPWLNQASWDFLYTRPLRSRAVPAQTGADISNHQRRAAQSVRHSWSIEPAEHASSTPRAEKSPTAPEPDLDTMVELPASTFTMGVEATTPGPYGDAWFIDQVPAHTVTLSPFSLDETETTVAEFAMFLTHAAGEYHFDPDQPIERVDGGYLPIEGREDEPIRHVTWEAARHYCLWAGKRLPTEAEWERAAAGEEGRTYPWGDEGSDCRRANHFTGSTYCENVPTPVGLRPEGSTPDGVLDMAGNVGEWVFDRYGFYAPDAAPETDPTGPTGGSMRVVRGGGFLDSGLSMQSRNRRGASPVRGSENIGFRCAHDGPPSDGALRGELSAPSDAGREPTDRPLAPAAEVPEVIAGGFARPTALVSLGDKLYLLDEPEGMLVALSQDGDSVEPIVEGLERPVDLVTDGTALFVTDQAAGEVLRVGIDGSVETIATAQANPTYLAADADGVFWITDVGVMHSPEEGGAEPLVELAGINGIALSATHLYYTSDGGGTAANAVVDRVPRGGGSPENLVGYSTFGVQYYPTSIVFDAVGDRALFLYRRRPAPGTYLCELPGGVAPHHCITYSPLVDPGADIEVVDGRVYWGTQQTLARIDPVADETFSELGGWTRPRGVVSTADGIVWTDWIDGRVYRLEQ